MRRTPRSNDQPRGNTDTTQDDEAIDRLPSVKAQVGLATSTLYKLMAEGKFPKPRNLTKRAVGWRRGDIRKWLASRCEQPASPAAGLGEAGQ